ncbi:MAG: TetR/AcrR family transcriptional regulator [Leptolinea sp.]|nr:TetR/AcrR family transcriptional regulator [Leptolinea sp.]
MTRQINEKTRNNKLNEILDCAERLIYSTGYEQMSIQDIISQLGISKGAFYHYFDSKPALMEALINRTSRKAVDVILPVLEDPHLTAPEKLEKFYSHTNRWKTTQQPYLMAIFKAWYKDENAIIRQKLTRDFSERFYVQLNRVFQQGIEEGFFHPTYPDMTGKVVFSLMIDLSDSLGMLLLSLINSPESSEDLATRRMEETILAYTDAIERILGARPGSIHLVDIEMLKKWFPRNLQSGQSPVHTLPERKEIQV